MNKITLNGTWQIRWSDGARGGSVNRLLVDQPELHRAFTAQVPGSIHLDLIQAGIIDEPATGLNVLKARWVEENYWFYRRTFNAPGLQSSEHAYLHFDCLDLIAVIYLNGHEVGRHANAFYPCRIDVTERLLPGENTLIVALESGLFYTAEKPYTGYGLAYDGALHKRHWLRQTQSTFEWDWSPRLLNVGIRGDVSLEICQEIRLESCVALSDLSEDLQTGKVTCRMFVEGLGKTDQIGEFIISMGAIQKVAEVKVSPGMNELELKLIISDPELWWPVGHGSHPLYEVHAVLRVNEQEITATNKIGFRQVEIDQSIHPTSGRFFIVKVNHKPIFCKGGNLVPGDLILARLDRDRYEMLTERALEANFNLLRVWGGGLYEANSFYELCDAKGLLVWQEFIFACAKYPVHDEAFLADVEREATYQVRRLANHPSLVVWCGNNELEWGAWGWGYHKGVAHPDYALFHLILPRILQKEDGTRYYQPSSPYSPELQFPNQDDLGDQHPWSVGFANTDFRDYRQMACRFPNEGGFLGPTSLPTMQACLDGNTSPFNTQDGAVSSFAFEIHDNQIAHLDNHTQADIALDQWLGLKVNEMNLEDFTYYGGLLQGEALGEYIRNFRRRMFDSASAIFWMYNDVWPATRSWTIVDYFGRRTPSFYPVHRAFQAVTVILAVENDEVKVFGVNEGPELQANLLFGIFALSGGYPFRQEKQVILASNASTLLAKFPLADLLQSGVNSHGTFAILRTTSGEEVGRDIYFMPLYKEMDWPQAHLTIRREGEKAIFESDTIAWRVCLDLSGQPMADNFFDVLPGIPTKLHWPAELGEPQVLKVGNLAKKI